MARIMSFLRKQESKKKYKYSKFLKLKARFILALLWIPAFAGMTPSVFFEPCNNAGTKHCCNLRNFIILHEIADVQNLQFFLAMTIF
ncbi:hypothetical protein JS61_06395 [Rickettsia felis]|nr:hypothetical protein JS61_06395 [Rickettsia felis]